MIYNFPASEPGFIESHRLTLEAGRVKILESYGRTFVCTNSAGGFKVSFNNGKYFDCRSGVEWSLQEDERYNLLKLISDSAQTVDLLTGNFFYHENIVEPVVKVAKTIIKPNSLEILAANTSHTFEGIGASGSGFGYRKHMIVTNCDPALDLEVIDSDENLAGTVFFRQANVFETSDELTVWNNNASPVSLRVMEIFYLE